jgi:hypothetical protein
VCPSRTETANENRAKGAAGRVDKKGRPRSELTYYGSEDVVDAGEALLVPELVEELGEAEGRARTPALEALALPHTAGLEEAAVSGQLDPGHQVAPVQVELALGAPEVRGRRCRRSGRRRRRGVRPQVRRLAARAVPASLLRLLGMISRSALGLPLAQRPVQGRDAARAPRGSARLVAPHVPRRLRLLPDTCN